MYVSMKPLIYIDNELVIKMFWKQQNSKKKKNLLYFGEESLFTRC